MAPNSVLSPRSIWLTALILTASTAGLLTISQSHARSLSGALSDPSQADHSHAFRTFIVLQEADCSSNLEVLRVFAQRRYRDHFAVTALIANSLPPDRLGAVREQLQQFAPVIDVLPISRAAAQPLTALGYTRTPFLVILDSQGAVRLARYPPLSFESLQRFAEELDLLMERDSEDQG